MRSLQRSKTRKNISCTYTKELVSKAPQEELKNFYG